MLKSVAALTGVLLALTACGGEDDSREGSSTSSGPIELHQITFTESQVASVPFIASAAQAAVEEINAAGGVQGRDLELVVCNERFDANEAMRCARDAAEAEADAVVGMLTQHEAQVMPVLEQADIAAIGTDAVTPVAAKSPNSFLIDPGVPGYAAMPSVAQKYEDAERVAIMDLDTSSAATNQIYFELGAEQSGVEIVDRIIVPTDALDYAPYVARADDSGAQAIITAMTPESLLKLWKAREDSGSDIVVISSSSNVTPTTLEQAAGTAEGDYVLSGTPTADDTNPWGEAYVAAVREYVPEEEVFGSLGLRAYAAVHLFAEVAETIEGEINSASVLEAFQQVSGMGFMWVPSLSFDKPGPIDELPRIVSSMIFPSRIENGTFVGLDSFDPFAE